jgi:predicted RNase H-like nuclease (RuvC/YqgF family)
MRKHQRPKRPNLSHQEWQSLNAQAVAAYRVGNYPKGTALAERALTLARQQGVVEKSKVVEGKMERGFAAVADDITDIKSKMATKGDIANLGGQLTSVERELKSIRRDLDDLREKVENVSGFQKEIDHALERIAAIEKHLGLDKKIAA